jgi:NADH:ubiquinone oxidoreductase subunit 6 (chain J)
MSFVCPSALFILSPAVFALINWHTIFFFVFAALACGFAIAVAVADNVVRMALYLVLSLGATAGLFFLAGAEFVGAMQLMIYVGGTLVLLVFGVMLTAQSPFVTMRSSVKDRVLAGVAAFALLGILLQAAVSVESWREPAAGLVEQPAATPLGMALVGVRVDDAPENSPVGAVRSGYPSSFPNSICTSPCCAYWGSLSLLEQSVARRHVLIEVAASVEPPASVAEHQAKGLQRISLVPLSVADWGWVREWLFLCSLIPGFLK